MAYYMRICVVLAAICAPGLTVPQGCAGVVDLILMVDSSSSMQDLSPFHDPLAAWRSHQAFLKLLVTHLPVGEADTRVALVTYSTTPAVNFHLHEHTTAINVQDAILAASFRGGNTNSAAALRTTQRLVALSHRPETGVRKIVVLFTDGLTNLESENTRSAVDALRAQGVQIFVIAVSDEIDYELLHYMASAPQDKHLLLVSGLGELREELALLLAHRICDVEDPITTRPPPSCMSGCGACAQDDVCERCALGFYKRNNQCLPCPTHCGVCEDNRTCTVCSAGWYLDPNTASCEACEVKADLVLMIDSSGSIRDANPPDGSYDNYQLVKDFIKGILSRLDVRPDRTRVGAVIFSSTANVLFYLDEFITGEQMAERIQNMPYHGHKTNTAAALNLMHSRVFSGSRGDRPGVRNVGLVITDGESTVHHDLTQEEGRRARAAGIALFVVGATEYINVEELKGIASDPDEEHFFESPEIRSLDSVMNSLIKHVCTPAA